jgi:hypothetical protein
VGAELPKSRRRKRKDITTVKLGPKSIDLLSEPRAAFIAKHGREPGPGDRVFDGFDSPDQMMTDVIAVMRKAGINEAIIYACQKTGLLLSQTTLTPIRPTLCANGTRPCYEAFEMLTLQRARELYAEGQV